MLDYIKNGSKAKFCITNNPDNYINYTLLRKKCYQNCPRDCFEESFKTTIDVSIIENANRSKTNLIFKKEKLTLDAETILPGKYKIAKRSIIVIWPNREMFQEVIHESELKFFEFIGSLGGHAHMWLGLSIIQFYDVFEKMFLRARYLVKLIWKKLDQIRSKN